jgi:hypothetical protein
MAVSYLSLVEQLVKKIGDNIQAGNLVANFETSLAVPALFETHEVTYKNERKPIMRHIVRYVSPLRNFAFMLMFYDTNIKGEGGVIERAKRFANFLDDYAPREKVYLGFETARVEAPNISHYGKSFFKFRSDISPAVRVMESFKSFAGIAVHDASSLQEMK